MLPAGWKDFLASAHAGRVSASRARTLRTLEPDSTASRERVRQAGRELVSFASNDYLGLAASPLLREAAAQASQAYGVGSGASRLVSGTTTLHAELERKLAEFAGAESCLLYTTGYQANLGVVGALAHEGVTVVSDALNHASIIDGCRLARANVKVFAHKDYPAASRLLREAGTGLKLLVSDTLFSMDGDLADVTALETLAREHGALLMLDEAHAFGCLGTRGAGLSPQTARSGIVTGTLSKAAGSLGGFALCSADMREHLLNASRSFMFSTAADLPAVAAASAALDFFASREGAAARERLAANATRLRDGLTRLGLETGGESHVVPLWIGKDGDALALSAKLEERGYLVPTIRPPAVPVGRAMLRFSLSASHTVEQIDILLGMFGE